MEDGDTECPMVLQQGNIFLGGAVRGGTLARPYLQRLAAMIAGCRPAPSCSPAFLLLV